MKLIFFFFCVLILTDWIQCDNLPSGHLKPFGAVDPSSILKLKEFHEQYPNISQFFNDHLNRFHGFHGQQVLKDDIRFESWSTDKKIQEQLNQVDSFDVFTQTVREPDRSPMDFKEFLRRYQRENIFLADKLPAALRRNVVIPRPLQCPMVFQTIENVILVMNRLSISPIIFNEDYHHIFCLYRGEKRFVLVNGQEHTEFLQSIRHGRASFINPERVDFKQYPAFTNLSYYHVNVTAGDCLFIPKDWIFQERSMETTVSVIFYILHKRASKIQPVTMDQCSKLIRDDPATYTVDEIDWSSKDHEVESLKQIMMNIVNSTTNTYDQWQKVFSKHLSFDIGTDSETQSIFDEFYGIVDIDGDGQITQIEVEQIDGSQQYHISDILYELVKKIDGRESIPSLDENVHSQTLKADL